MRIPANLTPAMLDRLIKGMSADEAAELLAMFDELEERKRVSLCQNDFLAFIGAVDPRYKFGAHLKRLGGLLMDVEKGYKDRIAVSMAPRMGKSQMISIYYPAWYLGRNPDHKVIVASHTADLAVVMARKVRNLMQTAEFQRIFPNTRISPDAKAAGQWNTTAGGEYFAIGVGGALAGRGAHLIIADDPHSEQDLKSSNFTSLDATYEWFTAGLRTRLMPEGKICVLHCLTGDTRIALADGTTKALVDVRPGDMVASYRDGKFTPAKVLLWANQGLDRVYSIALRSGVIIRGNERHPLLVNEAGVERWVKIKDLRLGMRIVCAANPNAQSPYTPSIGAGTTTTKPDEKIPTSGLGTGASGRGLRARLLAAVNRRMPWGYASLAGTRPDMQSARPQVTTIAPRSEVTLISRCSTASLGLTTTACLPSKTVFANSATSLRTKGTPPLHGKFGAWLLTTATRLVESVRSCATHATSWSKSATPPNYSAEPLSMWSTTLDPIVGIHLGGEEEVFDIQVEGTENFVANGVVSHNTRWHQRDLIGRLVKDSAMNEAGDKYEVFEFPAILNEGTPEEKSIWPEQWSLEALQKTRASMHHIMWQWYAQYQQNPTASEAAIIKRDWIKWWTQPDPPEGIEFIVQSYDTALTTKERSDFSVCGTWGVWKDKNGVDNAILLNCVRGKYEFPELKAMAIEQASEWEPDSVIVEAKASGQPLIDEMRRSGLFVQDFSPGKGQDKIARVNAVADMFASGQVWFPETPWAAQVVEEILAFPAGEHDDTVDMTTLALMRIRKGGMLRLTTDQADNEPYYRANRAAYY